MHKVPPLLYCNTLELLTAINGGFARAQCGHNGHNGKLKGCISFLQPCAFPTASLERAGQGGYNTVLNLSHSPPSPGAATLSLAVQEWLSKLSKALKDAISCFSLVWCCFSRASCSTTCSTKGRQVLRKQSVFLSSVAITSVCIHPVHVLHPTFNVVDVNAVPQLSLQSQMGSIYFWTSYHRWQPKSLEQNKAQTQKSNQPANQPNEG